MRTAKTILSVVAVAIAFAQPAAAEGFFDKLKKSLFDSKKSDVVEALSDSDIGAGLKEALRVGTETVVGNLGQTDGFNLDPVAHIPLPGSLRKAQKLLDKFGMGSVADNLEERLNRAAEVATPKAKALFWQSIQDMTLDDVQAIYNGPDDAATQYFKRSMTPDLKAELRPVIDASLAEVGAIRAYDKFVGEYKDIPFVPDVKANLGDHVMTKTLDGVFYYVAQEEAAIRRDPAKRTTDILKKVFGAN